MIERAFTHLNQANDRAEIVRFLLAGLINTAVHFCVLFASYHWFGIPLVGGVFLGFVAATLSGYFLSYVFTFKSTRLHSQSMPRFVVTVLLGLLWNTRITVLLVDYLEQSLLFAVIAAAIVIMINNYLLGKYWVFK